MSAAYQALLDKTRAPADRVRAGDNLAADQLRREGEALSSEEAAALEAGLASHPDDVVARARLLGYYDRDEFKDDGRLRRKPHTLWLIRALPESSLLDAPFAQPDRAWAAEARRAWEPVVASSTASAEALGTAAGSLAPFDDDEAEGWLRRAAKLQPTRALWRDMLAEIDIRRADRSDKWAASALDELDAAAALGASHTGDRRPDQVRLAFQSGRFARAGKDARALLADLDGVPEFQRAEAVYEAGQVLARLALRQGRLGDARARLIASCGGAEAADDYAVHPEPSVALELEARGQKWALADFEQACARFPSWKARAEGARAAVRTAPAR
jgi:hypothetical protein